MPHVESDSQADTKREAARAPIRAAWQKQIIGYAYSIALQRTLSSKHKRDDDDGDEEMKTPPVQAIPARKLSGGNVASNSHEHTSRKRDLSDPFTLRRATAATSSSSSSATLRAATQARPATSVADEPERITMTTTKRKSRMEIG
ncbi:MAG: hypothetical protein M1816_004084 [Peltula sp. TS41687]|nr:MAG: hypothetical protein M1816_004084 [Peltula sp. TS41687]